jgi:CHAD domain-containing protein
MTYRLEPQHPVSHSVRQIAQSQIGDILAAFGDEASSAKAVHETRKALKRLRALLSLVRHGIEDDDLRRERDRLRAIARSLAGARDGHVMLETARALQERGLPRDCRTASRMAISLLEERQDSAGAGGPATQSAGLPLETLREAHQAIAGLPVEALDFRDVLRGFIETYRRGRRLHRDAFAAGAEDERIHDLRKQVQQHWRHLQLLTNAWPKALRPQIALARDLSETLGRDHDIAMLAALAREAADAQAEDRASRFDAYIELCAREQAELRRQAERLARRLYAEKPKSLRRRIRIYWETARLPGDGKRLGNGHAEAAAAEG